MRDTGYHFSKQLKQKFSQGGEKKVMKKSLSAILAAALVFGSFGSLAYAADAPTAQEKFDALKAKGIFAGINGEAALDQEMTRAQFARVAALLLELDGIGSPDTKSVTVKPFSDVALGAWYTEEIAAVKEAKIMAGNANGTFNAGGKITVQETAVVLANVLGLAPAADATVEGASPWAAGYIKAVEAAGVVLPTAYKANATRELLVSAAFAAEAAINTPKEFAVVKAAQSGAKKITVDFSRALTAEEVKALTAEVKSGLVPYPVTIKASDDMKSAVLEATFLPAAEYSVVINKLEAVKVTVAAAVVSKVEIGATALQKAADQDLAVKALNQFNEEVANSGTIVSVYSSVYGSLTVTGGKVNLSNEAIDNTIVVTASHPTTGLSASKTFKVVAASSATSIQLGAVAPLKDKTRITAGESGLVLPVTLKDQYGTVIKLPVTTATNADLISVQIGGINFVVSDKTIVDASSLAVDGDGVVTFKALKEGTVVITAVNPSTGASASVAVKVEAASALKTLQVSAPSSIVVVGEAVTFPYVAADTFGAPIAAKDVPSKVAGLANDSTGFVIQANGLAVGTSWKANGDLQLTFPTKGNQNVIVWHKGAIASQFNVTVEDVAYPVSIAGTKDLKTTLTVGATQTVDFGKLVVRDNYGRTMSAAGDWTLGFAEASALSTSAVTYSGTTVTAANVGTEKVTATLSKTGFTSVTFDITFNVIANDKVTALTVSTIGTVYGNSSMTSASAHAATISLTGKTAEGTEVAIVAGSFYDLVTTSDASIVGIDSPTALVVYGKAKGTAVVTVWKNGAKLAEQTITVSDAAPIATTVKFDAAETSDLAIAGKLSVKDQYGVAKADAGTWFTSDSSVATVSAGTVTKVKSGIVTITYVSANGISASIVVNVD